jgi:hypothetical protein
MDHMVRLDVGWRAGAKALTIVVGIVIALCAAVLVAMVSGIVATFSPAAVVAVFAVVLSALLLFLVLRLVLGIVRAGARLEGTTLVVVRALTTRRCDLATADVSLDSVLVRNGGARVSVPLLIARGPRTGATVTLRLRTTAGPLLPPDQVEAVARAIEAGGRDEPAAERTRRVVASLRQLDTGGVLRQA